MKHYKLPELSEEVCATMSEAVWLLYGLRKIGKSILASQFPDPFFCFFEPGGRFIPRKKDNFKTWKKFKRMLKAIKKKPSYCKTLILDTAYGAYEACYWY